MHQQSPITPLSLLLLAVGLHLFVALLFPTQGWVTICGIDLALIITSCLCISKVFQLEGLLKVKWLLLAGVFILWAVALGCNLYGEIAWQAAPSHAWAFDLFIELRDVLLLLIVSLHIDSDDPPLVMSIDILQLIIIVVVMMVWIHPDILEVNSSMSLPREEIMDNQFTELGLLAMMSFLRWSSSKDDIEKVFYRCLLALTCVMLVTVYIANVIFIRRMQVPSGSPLFTLVDFVPLSLALMLRLPQDALNPPKMPIIVDNVIRRGSSAFVPLGTILVSMIAGMEYHHTRIGITCALLSFFGYAISSASLMGAYRVRQDGLELQRYDLHLAARTDALTGLSNRRWFDEVYPSEFERAIRGRQELSILMIDVDYFKRYNDHFGHPQGDECLKAVAGALGAALNRIHDMVARYGGEEFVAVLPNAGATGATEIAEAMREAVWRLDRAHPASPHQRVTISVGVAVLQESDQLVSAQRLIDLADANLYQAKSNGRNTIWQTSLLTL